MNYSKHKKFFMSAITAILINFISLSTQAGNLESDLHKVNTVFEIQLHKGNLGAILQYCYPQFEKCIKISRELQGNFTALFYLVTMASEDTLRELILAFEKHISEKYKDKSGAFRSDRFYFYDTVIQAFECRKDWALLSSLICNNSGRNKLENTITSMLARRTIYNLLKNENLFILACFHNGTSSPSAHERSRKLGINSFQPRLSAMFNADETLGLVAKDIIEALSPRKPNSQDPTAEDIMRTFIDFYDSTLPKFGRSTEKCHYHTIKTFHYLDLAKKFCPTHETDRVGRKIEEIFNKAKSDHKINNTMFNIDIPNDIHNNPQQRKRTLNTLENKGGILKQQREGEASNKRMKVSFQEPLKTGTDQTVVDSIDMLPVNNEADVQEAPIEIETPLQRNESLLPFNWLQWEKLTCSYSLQIILGNYPNDVILNLLKHSNTPEICKINEIEIPTALIMTGYKKLELLKDFVHSPLFVNHGLNIQCGDNLNVREAIFMHLLNEGEEAQSIALELLADGSFIGEAQNLPKLIQSFFEAYFSKNISTTVLLKYFSLPVQTCPYLALDAQNNADILRQQIILSLLNSNEYKKALSLLDMESFVTKNNAAKIAFSIFELALANNQFTFATQLLHLGKVSLDQSVSFTK